MFAAVLCKQFCATIQTFLYGVLFMFNTQGTITIIKKINRIMFNTQGTITIIKKIYRIVIKICFVFMMIC